MSVTEEIKVDGASYTKIVYEIYLPEDYKKEFTEEEKTWCRPIAETLAMLDGNAFFTQETNPGVKWYEQYLPEAWQIFSGNGGTSGWATETSWMRDVLHHETSAVEEAYKQWRTLKTLSKD
jgi:hypothetical protein